MTRNAVTERYLDHITRLGLVGNELRDAAHRAVDLGPSSYNGRCSTRPVFVDAAERALLETDLGNLHAALISLPDRLFGGDLGAFARASGMTDVQVAAILRTRSQTPTRLGRADLYHDGAHFRLMELNMGSNVGGLDNAMLNRAFLTHPAVAEFVEGNGLSYVDTMVELAGMLLTESGVAEGERPLIAAADTPEAFAMLEPQLRTSAAWLGELGIEIVPCHLGQFQVKGGRVWLDGRPVDVIYRVFMVEDMLEDDHRELIDPVLLAAERGEVTIFCPMDTELYGGKAALAMLSDEANRGLLGADELASVDRLLPWTRMVRDGDVTVDGERVNFLSYATERREDLVLKPTLMHGGLGVVLGWTVEADEWAARLREAVDGPYVVQRRIHGRPELFPTEDGLRPALLNWGVFTVASGYGGAIVRASSDLTGATLNSAAGAALTCCFHEETAE